MPAGKAVSTKQMESDMEYWIIFIKKCQDHPVLWNQSSEAEKAAYRDLIPYLKRKDPDANDLSVRNYIKKFKLDLKSDFFQELRGKRPKTFYFEHLQFLRDYVIPDQERNITEDTPVDEEPTASGSNDTSLSLELDRLRTQITYLQNENEQLRSRLAALTNTTIESGVANLSLEKP